METNGSQMYSVKEMIAQLMAQVQKIDEKLDNIREQKADKSVVANLEGRLINIEQNGSANSREVINDVNKIANRVTAIETWPHAQITEDVKKLLVDNQRFREIQAASEVERKLYMPIWEAIVADVKMLKKQADENNGIIGYKRWIFPMIISAGMSLLSTYLFIHYSTGKI